MSNSDSGEVRGKGRKHLLDYVTMDVSQPIGDRHAAELLWGSLPESYAEGGCEMHVHFRAGFVNGGIASDWCTIFNRAEDWFKFVHTQEELVGETNVREKRNVRQTVLVLDGKLVELPKGIVGGFLPSVVRLQPLDNCFRVWMDAPKHAIEFFRVLCLEDREPGTSLDIARQWRSLICQGQLECEVVEGGTEIVDTVTDDETQFGSRRGLKHFNPKELLGAINIGFGPSSVRVFLAPNAQFGFKALQVVERSVEPSFVVETH